MLGKLIKYDLKSLNRFLVMIHALLLLTALLIRYFLTGQINSSTPQNSLLLALSITLYVLILIAVSFATAIIITIRFYKNLFSDEGYLTHTLPVTRGQHLLSKTIAGSIWSCLDIFFIFASLYIVSATPYISIMLKEQWAEMIEELGFTDLSMSPAALIALFIGFICFSAVSNVITYYASVALGQLVPGHKILGAIAAYFALNTGLSIITLLMMSIFGLFIAPSYSTYMNSSSFSYSVYLLDSMKLSTTIAFITAIILYIVTYYILNKKTNLE